MNINKGMVPTSTEERVALLTSVNFSPVHQSSRTVSRHMKELALILCHHGQDPSRLQAARRALEWTLSSTPLPRIYFVEAVDEGTPYHFDTLENVTHIKRMVGERSKGIWKKEALWTIGAREALKDPFIQCLVFLDVDCCFANQDWAIPVRDSFRAYDVISPHSHMYYSEQEDGRKLGLLESAGYAILTKGKGGHPGMALGMTRKFFVDTLDSRIPLLSTGSGDTFFWLYVAGKEKFPVNRASFNHSLTPRQFRGLLPTPRIGHANQLIVHYPHGPLSERGYRERAVCTRASSSALGDDFEYLEDGMPAWKDTPGGRLLSKSYPRILEIARGGGRISPVMARDVYDEEAIKEYGAIDDAHPLIVTTLLRSGGSYDHRHVHWLKRQFDKHCKAPFRFVCQSDVDVPGIETIPLVLDRVDGATFWGQVEHYRDIWPKGASILTCDLDTVVFRDFTPHRCPEGELFMLREIGNWYRSEWATWGGGLTYFRGDFSFIFQSFQLDCAAGGQQHPHFQCIAPQEFVTSCLRARGMAPCDIEAHFCVRYYQGYKESISPEAHFAIFPDHPKPWELTPLPGWVPPMEEKP